MLYDDIVSCSHQGVYTEKEEIETYVIKIHLKNAKKEENHTTS